jgi:hypothetical protein
MTPSNLFRLPRVTRPVVAVRQAAGPNPVEYAVLFLVVVAGVLTLVR